MKTIVAYCRTASALQGDPRASIMGQAKAMLRYAKRRGMAIHETYLDAGESGLRFDRPELQRLLADCCDGRVGMVITQDPERLSRDTGQLLVLLHIFLKAGVRVEFSTEEGRHRLAVLGFSLSTLAALEDAKIRCSRKRRIIYAA